MTTASAVLALLGALIAVYGPVGVLRRNSDRAGNVLVVPTGAYLHAIRGRPIVTNAQSSRSARFRQLIHHTPRTDAQLTRSEPWERDIEDLAQQVTTAQAEELDRLRQEIAADRAVDRAKRDADRAYTRRQAWITLIGLAMTVVGIVLRFFL
jgi:hypothetical protein